MRFIKGLKADTKQLQGYKKKGEGTMNKAHRYTNYIVKSCYEKFKSGLYNYEWLESAQNAEKIVRTFERGFITENEAMRLLAELSY